MRMHTFGRWTTDALCISGHNRALDEADDYFRDTYGGRTIHLAGLDTGQDDL